MTDEKDVAKEFTRACPVCGDYEVSCSMVTYHSHPGDGETCFIFVMECPSCGRLPVHLTRDRLEDKDGDEDYDRG